MYEETADIHKGAFVREEVKIVKEVEQDVVEAEEILRREELDVNSQDVKKGLSPFLTLSINS